MSKRKEIDLREIGLGYFNRGIEKKIHTLICENLHCRITYTTIQQQKKFKDHYSSLRAHHAGYGNTYDIKVVDKRLFNINSLIKFFKTHNTVLYRRKEREIDSEKYILILKGLK